MDLDNASQQNPRCGEGKVLKLSIQQRSTKNIKDHQRAKGHTHTIRINQTYTPGQPLLHLFISFYTVTDLILVLAGQGKKTTHAETAGHTGTAGFGTVGGRG